LSLEAVSVAIARAVAVWYEHSESTVIIYKNVR
jgi:hypothetical protein